MNMGSDRVTIMLDNDLNKKIRILQAKKIQQLQSSFSFSKMLNQILREAL